MVSYDVVVRYDTLPLYYQVRCIMLGPEGATMPAERLQATIWGVRGANLKRGSVRGESPTPYGAPTVEVYRGHWFLRGFRNLTPVPPVAFYAGVPGA